MNRFESPCPGAAMATLQTRDLYLGYGRRMVVNGLDLHIPQGQVTVIVGPNGCGKSTLLAGLARLNKPRSGAVLLNGQPIGSLATRDVARLLALLPQDASAPEGITVNELIRFGRQPHQGLMRQWSAQDQLIVESALQAANLVELADRALESMSGGQRQRAWMAMAIAQDTPLLLLDEPTSALDLGHQIEVFELVRQLSHAGKTVVMVLHDLSSACRYADHLVAMKAGRIVIEGAPDTVVTSALIEELYGVSCMLVKCPRTGAPVITAVEPLPRERQRQPCRTKVVAGV
ncbi:ABC transporter ATP-binding protein [Pseudomonas fluorescens]|uniref:Putative siderophore transport system ATP-binding protein YusV n=1 Tax=Pseudomonas fluorescens TaxID=294 RepID=A0A5E7CX83_PSEFL|nr:ABC transporter ATP-binding protein [Pseudomonas fluorescens]VVO04355.1 putative siderophore transport system ATP-binding protein YusV [Pseudomonas fluorescens]VVQ05531.1 putative siderophore transport system ATP-binding protein YusV [Pseudomonas fluorescens]